jgi:predicted DCC family thiol-disulfide oxidoreductase YuxK
MGTVDKVIPKQTILFDGVCNLCNSSVQFVINRDPHRSFQFAALQSISGKALLQQHHLPEANLYSVILIREGTVYQRSSAALQIARGLTGWWPLLYAFIIVPPFIRNAVYDWIASNRYRWFGEKNECMIPTPELKSRFLA